MRPLISSNSCKIDSNYWRPMKGFFFLFSIILTNKNWISILAMDNSIAGWKSFFLFNGEYLFVGSQSTLARTSDAPRTNFASRGTSFVTAWITAATSPTRLPPPSVPVSSNYHRFIFHTLFPRGEGSFLGFQMKYAAGPNWFVIEPGLSGRRIPTPDTAA